MTATIAPPAPPTGHPQGRPTGDQLAQHLHLTLGCALTRADGRPVSYFTDGPSDHWKNQQMSALAHSAAHITIEWIAANVPGATGPLIDAGLLNPQRADLAAILHTLTIQETR